MANVPIISPKTPGEWAKDFKASKMRLKELGYPNRETAALTVKYFNEIKDRIRGIDKDTVVAMVPSGSNHNKITLILGILLEGHFGCTLLPPNSIVKTNAGEAKNNLSLEKRNNNPITYRIDAERIRKIVAGRRVVIFDDVIGSGESSIRLKQTFEKARIDVAGLMALVTVEKYYPTVNDMQRVQNKFETATSLNKKQAQTLARDMEVAFSPFTRQKLNRVERVITDRSAIKLIADIARAASLEREHKKNIGKYLTLDDQWASPKISPFTKESKARGM